MTNPIDEQEARDAAAATARRDLAMQRKQERADVISAMADAALRRMLWRFLEDAGQGLSVFRDRPHAMAHAAGWQDAASWWLNQIRTHCPEREAQMRAEARKRDKPNEDSDANE